VNIAAANDVIYVDAGTYTEQVTITKGITIIGAGQNATFILKPVTTAPPPGTFTEQGVIQTSQNIGDVTLKDYQ
jgi:pectin methylesterase-like acyl-CoA thioesterase